MNAAKSAPPGPRGEKARLNAIQHLIREHDPAAFMPPSGGFYDLVGSSNPHGDCRDASKSGHSAGAAESAKAVLRHHLVSHGPLARLDGGP